MRLYSALYSKVLALLDGPIDQLQKSNLNVMLQILNELRQITSSLLLRANILDYKVEA